MNREQRLSEVFRKYESAYSKKTPRSLQQLEAAKKYMPGGDTRTSIWFPPYPLWIEKAEGCRFHDAEIGRAHV